MLGLLLYFHYQIKHKPKDLSWVNLKFNAIPIIKIIFHTSLILTKLKITTLLQKRKLQPKRSFTLLW